MSLEFCLDWTGRLVKSCMTGLKNWTRNWTSSGPVPVIFWTQRLDFKTLQGMQQITQQTYVVQLPDHMPAHDCNEIAQHQAGLGLNVSLDGQQVIGDITVG